MPWINFTFGYITIFKDITKLSYNSIIDFFNIIIRELDRYINTIKAESLLRLCP